MWPSEAEVLEQGALMGQERVLKGECCQPHDCVPVSWGLKGENLTQEYQSVEGIERREEKLPSTLNII